MRRLLRFCRRYRYPLLTVFTGLSLWYYFCLPSRPFDKPCSTVLFDREGKLLCAKIASDGQWRFPPAAGVPEKFKQALIAFEDKRFYSHWGIDFAALGRALWSNLSSGRRVSGGSTLTMQTVRLMRNNPGRTLWEKWTEMVLATRMEWSYDKDQILLMYASNAPFGGNVVGLDAAAWKYFGRSAEQLSWAESALLAVLPNSPSMLHLGKNRPALQAKRDALLDKLKKQGVIDSITCALAKLETLPDKPLPLPQLAPHLLERLHRDYVLPARLPDGLVRSTLDAHLQERVGEILVRHHEQLRGNEIYNAAALVVDVQTGDVLAYHGNVPGLEPEHSPAVDVVMAPRSSGSILKPFLYAAALDDGEIAPRSLLPDLPSQYGSYTPKNFDGEHRGAVPAADLVARSLNIPSVHLLQRYGVVRFHHKLKELGMNTLRHNAEHYGLTLILGGAEARLWDLGAMYAGMARTLGNFYAYDGKYDPSAFRPLNLFAAESRGLLPAERRGELQAGSPLRAAAIWHAFDAMQELARPGEEQHWQRFASSNRVAWKTGTSFGFRDAWAVGLTPRYVVAVWAGNADGEGRPGLVGVQVAAPILFDIFHELGHSRQWFQAPYDEMQRSVVCRHSGHPAGEHCPEVDSLWLATPAAQTRPCPYHRLAHLDPSGKYRVHSDCQSPQNMQQRVFFVLPAAQEWYYKKQHPSYEDLPPYREDCKAALPAQRSLALLYPHSHDLKIYVPRELDERRGRTVFEAAHTDPHARLFWHLDDVYVGETKQFHRLSIDPPAGKHTLTVVDEEGEQVQRRFEVLVGEG